jgi:hypothetical protein
MTSPSPKDFVLARSLAVAIASHQDRAPTPEDYEVACWCLTRFPNGPLAGLRPQQLAPASNGTRVDVSALIG